MTVLDASVLHVLEIRPLAVLADIDGCLAVLEEFASETAVEGAALDALQRLSVLAGVRVLANSGRPLLSTANTQGLADLIGLEGITYSGSHGLEYSDGFPQRGGNYVISQAREWLGPVATVKQFATEELIPSLRHDGADSTRSGIYVEEKGASFAIHFRPLLNRLGKEATMSRQANVAEQLQRHIDRLQLGLRLRAEHLVLEVRPPVDSSKRARALDFIRATGSRAALGWGDAYTDLDALYGIREARVPSFFVAVRQGESTPDELIRDADLTVDGVSEMVSWLEAVVDWLTQHWNDVA